MIATPSTFANESWRRHEETFNRFELAWSSNGPPPIEDFLPPADSQDYLPILVELVRIDLERHWQRGTPVKVEDYLRRFPTLAVQEAIPAELIQQEIHVRCRLNRSPSRDELLRRFPDLTMAWSEALDASAGKNGSNDRCLVAPTELRAESLGRYRIRERLGRGGFASVYRAWDPELARDVAIKIPRDDLLGDEDSRTRIGREARTAARLRHPGIVPLYEVGQDSARVWLVYEFIRGPSLAEVLRATRPAARQAAAWAAAIAEVLDYAHQAGVIHRDLKPANVLLRGGTDPVLTDFGLALHNQNMSTLTQQGEVLGTPAYMSPEQARGQSHEVDGRSDVYSLGVLLYEMLAGQLPFQAHAAVILHKVLHEEPTPVRTIRPEIPVDLETICLKAMAKQPSQRYRTAGEFADDLHRYLNHQPIRARRIGPLGQLRRWCQRNPAIAATLAFAFTVITLVVGLSYRQVQGERDRYRQERDRAQALAANLAFDRGLNLCEQGEIGPGMLWLVRSLELSPNSEQEHAIRLNLDAWAAELPECRQVLIHPQMVGPISFDGETESIMTGATDGRIRRWTPDASIVVESAKVPTGISSMAVNCDRSLIVACCDNGTIWLWRQRLNAPPIVVNFVGGAQVAAFHPTRANVLLTATGNKALVVNLQSETILGEPIVYDHMVRAVAFHPDGSRMIHATNDGSVFVCEVDTHRRIARLPHSQVVSAAIYSPRGDRIATICQDNVVRLWDGENFELRFELQQSGISNALAFSPDGRLLLTGGTDRLARLWNTRTGKPVCPPIQHSSSVLSVAFGDDGRTFATGCGDGVVRVWKVPRTSADGEPLLHSAPVWSAAYSQDGNSILTGSGVRGNGTGVAQLWDAASRRKRGRELAHNEAVVAVAISPDSQVFLTGTQDGELTLWDNDSGQPIEQPIQKGRFVTALAFMPENYTFAVGWAGDNDLVLFDRTTRKPTGVRLIHGQSVRAVAVSSDGALILTGGYDHKARLWERATGRPIGEPWPHAGAVGAAALSRDGQMAVTGTDDSWAQIWNREGNEFVAGPRLPHKGTVRSVAIHPFRRLVLTGSWDKTARFWDPAAGRPIGPALPHLGEVETVAFAPDGQSCLTGGWGNRVHFWRPPTPAIGTVDELRSWAEIMSGQVLAGGESPRLLSTADWLDRWRRHSQR